MDATHSSWYSVVRGFECHAEFEELESVGHVERMGDRRGAYRVLVGIPEGK